MHYINLYDLYQIPLDFDKELYKTYLKYLSNSKSEFKIKRHELKTLQSFVSCFEETSACYENLNYFYLSYHIPQISKEFDLLRVSDKFVINIELKSKMTSMEKLKKQLNKNNYYLKSLNKEVYNFVYLEKENIIYKRINEKELKESNIGEIFSYLTKQNNPYKENLNKLFDVPNYLVSPFNNTKEFLDGSYFLTDHQEELKKEIITNLKEKEIIGLTGNAGTGKTLLVYDIAKHLSERNKVCIIHGGNLNKGQNKLKKEGYNIFPVKNIELLDYSDYDYIFVDEAQRLHPEQLNFLFNIESKTFGFLFSYDIKQYLNKKELTNDVVNNIIIKKTNNNYKLTNTIRTNKNILNFAERLIYNERKYRLNIKFDEIIIKYAKDIDKAQYFIKEYKELGYEFINYTPYKNANKSWMLFRETIEDPDYNFEYDKTNNPHKSIGQEFDYVLLTLSDDFFIKNGKLKAKAHYVDNYDYMRMLYQILTRTKKKLCIIIYNNKELFEKFIKIIK